MRFTVVCTYIYRKINKVFIINDQRSVHANDAPVLFEWFMQLNRTNISFEFLQFYFVYERVPSVVLGIWIVIFGHIRRDNATISESL